MLFKKRAMEAITPSGLIVPGSHFDSELCEQAGREVLDGLFTDEFLRESCVLKTERHPKSDVLEIAISLGRMEDRFRQRYEAIARLIGLLIPENPGSNMLTINITPPGQVIDKHIDAHPGVGLIVDLREPAVFCEYDREQPQRPPAETPLECGDSMAITNSEYEQFRIPHAVKNRGDGVRVSALTWHWTKAEPFEPIPSTTLEIDNNAFGMELAHPNRVVIEVGASKPRI